MQLIRNPTVRVKYRLTVFLWFVNGLALLLGALYLSGFLVIPLVALFLVVGLYTMSLRCPACGKRVLYNPVRLFGVELNMWTSWIPKRYTRCGKEMP